MTWRFYEDHPPPQIDSHGTPSLSRSSFLLPHWRAFCAWAQLVIWPQVRGMLEQSEPPVGWRDCGRWVWVVRSGLAVVPVSKGLAVVVLADAVTVARPISTHIMILICFTFLILWLIGIFPLLILVFVYSVCFTVFNSVFPSHLNIKKILHPFFIVLKGTFFV